MLVVISQCILTTFTLLPIIDVCTTGQIRLAGGGNPREGRVEICYYNQWGSVCDDGFGAPEARVVCKILGFSNVSKFLLFAVFTDIDPI